MQFKRPRPAPGQSRTVTFTLAAKDLSFWNSASHAWRVEDGVFDIAVGASSADIRVGCKMLPELFRWLALLRMFRALPSAGG